MPAHHVKRSFKSSTYAKDIEGQKCHTNGETPCRSTMQRSDTSSRLQQKYRRTTFISVCNVFMPISQYVSHLRPECDWLGIMYFRLRWLLNRPDWARSDGAAKESSTSSLSWKLTRIPGSGSWSDWGSSLSKMSLKWFQIWAADSCCGSHRLLFFLRPTVMPWNLSGENFCWRGNSLLRCFILGRFRRRCFLLWVFGATAVSVRNPLFRSVSVTEKSFRSAAY